MSANDGAVPSGAGVPRPRLPLVQRRCTCIWSTAEARTIADPFCPSAVLHVDDAGRQALGAS